MLALARKLPYIPIIRPSQILSSLNTYATLPPPPPPTVYIYGSPNSGKSSFLRSLLHLSSSSPYGVSAVSPKANTTDGVMEVEVVYGWGQVLCVDTPGLTKGEGGKGKR
eukprot:CAMPEP_0118646282 /NCGR_PEP_ID=MMETSP0785-20121206/7970_1 /TAXON_ID=91992 /ORGANISM="Bolidomonas pacifica, Strain CCMP 1866" /LENGTH=108 /DNA_ID=CAMNT_0006538259 /DNA_START=326 /DNA_END=649 /DNA_ORIENTATION=+